jgi:hypothetical protein
LKSIATSGSYNDLTDKPETTITLGTSGIQQTLADVAYSGSYNDLLNTPVFDFGEGGSQVYVLSAVAKSGDYNDLINKPDLAVDDGSASSSIQLATIATTGLLADAIQDNNYAMYVTNEEKDKWNSASTFTGSYNDLRNKPTLSAVATSGDYNDLLNKPALSAVAISGDYDDLLNKPVAARYLRDLVQDLDYSTTITTAERNLWDKKVGTSFLPRRLQDLEQDTGHLLVSAEERSQWNIAATRGSFSGSYGDLSNRPALKSIATSGSYNDLTDKPETTITLGTSGIQQTLADVAYSGSYNDLSNTPVFDFGEGGSQVYVLSAVAKSGDYNDLINKPDLAVDDGSASSSVQLATIATTGLLVDAIQDNNYAMYVTNEEKDKWNSASTFIGSYNDLREKPVIPTQLKELITDETHTVVTAAERERWNNLTGFSGNYNDLRDKPLIINTLIDMEQDDLYAMYVTRAEKERWDNKVVPSALPRRLSDLQQDAFYAMWVSKAEKVYWNAIGTGKQTVPTLLPVSEICCRMTITAQ